MFSYKIRSKFHKELIDVVIECMNKQLNSYAWNETYSAYVTPPMSHDQLRQLEDHMSRYIVVFSDLDGHLYVEEFNTEKEVEEIINTEEYEDYRSVVIKVDGDDLKIDIDYNT